MNELSISAYAWVQTQLYCLGESIKTHAADEGGMQVAEAVAMVAVILALLGAVAGVFKADNSIGEAATKTIKSWISNMQ
ncbi:MAG TPA: hypothetical protein VFS21_10245 [Roseiflexaceae bacterium]|nr:hypothetical protein [Roseiflexaceae bacterium]